MRIKTGNTQSSDNFVLEVAPAGGLAATVAEGTGSTLLTLGGGISEHTLAADTAAGATTGTLSRSVAPQIAGRSVLAIIEPFTTRCELREMASLSGSTVTFDRALLYTHAAGVPVIFSMEDTLNPVLWGAVGDDNTGTFVDDWAPLQRAVHETSVLSLWLSGLSRGYHIGQPIVAKDARMRNFVIRTNGAGQTAFAPVDVNNAMFMQCQDIGQTFTVDPATDTFTTPSAHSIGGVGNKIAFNAPMGETLPGGITAGRIYFVKTIPTGTTFTISATSGGATLDVTSTGTGWCYPDLLALGRAFFDDVNWKANLTNVNCVRMVVQQPCWTNKLRCDVVAGTGWGACIEGQGSTHWNYQGNIGGGAGSSRSLLLNGSGHDFFKTFLVGGGASGTYGLDIFDSTTGPDGAKASIINCSFHGLWTESLDAHIHVAGAGTPGEIFELGVYNWNYSTSAIARGLVIDAGVGASACSYVIHGVRFSDSAKAIVTDAVRSVTLLGSSFPAQAVAAIYQPASSVKPILGNYQKTRASGSSTTTPGVVATVNIAHGLPFTPTSAVVTPGDANARGAPTFYVTLDATNVILNFSSNLTGATPYTWNWQADV